MSPSPGWKSIGLFTDWENKTDIFPRSSLTADMTIDDQRCEFLPVTSRGAAGLARWVGSQCGGKKAHESTYMNWLPLFYKKRKDNTNFISVYDD